jgi:formamidopyrimidine-DNA glycosylase
MPELPDITIYLEALERRVLGQPITGIRLLNPFVLRSVEPPIDSLIGRRVVGLSRIGKRLVIEAEDSLFLLIHLMIAGRLRWRATDDVGGRPAPLATFSFPGGVLVLTEAGKKRRASLHVVRGREALGAFDRGGMEVIGSPPVEFAARLRSENHTVKRALTDPRLFSGIGNAYSDEILHRARLSPLLLTSRLTDVEVDRLHAAAIETLREWTDRLRAQTADRFPDKVTAFREGMAVHGRFRQPCPVCGAPIQRIRYADNETNYCARCQTGGRLLADRALSQLLKEDWPRSLEESD